MHGSTGKQIPGTSSNFVDEKTSTLFEGRMQRGVLHIHGPNLFSGYSQRAENDIETLADFVPAAIVMQGFILIYSQKLQDHKDGLLSATVSTLIHIDRKKNNCMNGEK